MPQTQMTMTVRTVSPEASIVDIGGEVTSGAENVLMDAYTQAIRVASNNVTSAKAHLGKANTLLRLRRSKEAVEAYDKAMELDPKIASASLYLAKGDAFWRFGQNEEALKAYEKGLELDPDLEILQQKRSAMLDILKKVRRA